MSDRPANSADAAPTWAAEEAIRRLSAMTSDLRGCAVLDPGDEVLAASGEAGRWGPAASALLAAADRAAGEPATQAHVATDDGEVFAVREDGLALVAVSERFALASLMLFDMRSVLRDVVRVAPAGNGADASDRVAGAARR